MRIGLFIPCYIDQFYPGVGLATLNLLERLGAAQGVKIDFPQQQTCCGQPMANTGCTDQARPLAERFLQLFSPYDYVVCPSGSCTAMVRHHYEEYLTDSPEFESLKNSTYELCEFLTKVLQLESLPGKFPHRVGLHQSCHGLRELRLASSSELVAPAHGGARRLLESLDGLELVELQRVDECCGFGGTFAVHEEAISCLMGEDRIRDHQRAKAEVITANDMSCLMHLDGLIQRQQVPLRVLHVAELFAIALDTQ